MPNRIRIKEHTTVRAADLIPNPSNWRVHPPAQAEAMRAILAEVGHVSEALAVKTRRGLMLVDGHLRQSLDPDDVLPVAVLDLSPAEARKVLGTFDVIGAMAERDDTKFRELLDGTDATTADFRKVLSDFQQQASGVSTAPARGGRGDPDAAPELTERASTKPGDIYQLGDHRLLCGDTTNADDVARLMAGAKAAMVLTDPPYAIYGSSTGIGSDMSDDKMVRPFFESILHVSAENVDLFAHVYVCCDWRSWPSWWEMAKRARLAPKNLIVWDKGGSGLGSSYANSYELIGFFAKLPKQTVMTSGFKRGQRTVHASNVMRFDKVPGGQREHNAAKPVALMAALIENSSDEGDIVVDWFAGSGSTLIAAEQTGRRCYNMEIDARYCDVIVRRWEAFTGQKATLERAKKERSHGARRAKPAKPRADGRAAAPEAADGNRQPAAAIPADPATGAAAPAD